jgi:uncharacterized iron-regulated protein
VSSGAAGAPFLDHAGRHPFGLRVGGWRRIGPLKHGSRKGAPAAPQLARFGVVALAIVVATAGCAKVTEIEWESQVARGHPLVGRVWDVKAARFVEPRELTDRLAASRWVLLGERHDNPDHHALQARLVRELVAAGRRPAVGFEMFSTDDAPAIARYLALHPKSAAGLGDAVNLKRSGWDWRVYQPIAQAALDAGLPIVATNLSRAATEALRKNGLGGLGRAMLTQLKLDAPRPPAVSASMAREIRESHCGQAPEGALDRMVDTQWARDARIAEALARAGGRDGAVLIAGAGHVRRDRGVPAHLARHAPGTPAASLAFLEVEATRTAPSDYATRFEGTLPFDYVWFTPRVDDVDPCEKFKKALEQLRKS